MLPLGRDFVPIDMTVIVSATAPDDGMGSESVAWTVKVAGGPGVTGVPEITPVVGLKVKPAGKLPLTMLQV